MLAQKPREHLGLGVAQLRKLGRDVSHGTVVLAHLVSARRGAYRCGVAIIRQRLRQHAWPVLLGHRLDQWAIPLLELADATPSEFEHRVVTGRVGKEPQSVYGEVVVLLCELLSTRVGDHEDLRWAAAPSMSRDPRLPRLDRPLDEELIKVPAYGSGCEIEPLREVSGRRRPRLEDALDHTITRRSVVRRRRLGGKRVFHNTSVLLFGDRFNQGWP